jgi:hypothetical protein
MTTYLQKQKKGDLIELAKQANISGYVSRTQTAT